MNKAKLLVIILFFSIVYYGLVGWVFYDHNRWAREFDFFQNLLDGNEMMFSQDQPPFWKRGLDFFMNDYRRHPRSGSRTSGDTRSWWQPNYSQDLKQRVGQYLRKFGGKLPLNPNLNLGSIQDSVMAMMEKMQQQDKKEFSQWLDAYHPAQDDIDDSQTLLFLMAGVSAYRNYDYVLAREILNKGLNSTNVPTLKAKFYQNLGFIEHELLNLNQAEKYFIQCLKLDPENASYLINIGWNCFLKKEFVRCMDYNTKAEAIDSSNWVPHFNIAISHLAMGEYMPAYQSYKRLTAGDLGENAFFYILEDLFTLQKMESQHAIINYFIGYTYLNKKMFTKAAEYFEIYLRNSGAYPKSITSEAEYYLTHIRNGSL